MARAAVCMVSAVRNARWMSEGGLWLVTWVGTVVAYWLLGKATGVPADWITCAVFAAVALASGTLSERWHRYRRSRKQARAVSMPCNE